MTCVDVMYQPYAATFPYYRPSELSQTFGAQKMHDSHDAGGYSAAGVKEEELDKDSQPKETQYLNANCVVLTYFSGDISSVVDEHFSRALSQPSSYNSETPSSKQPTCKGTSPMSQRNFPPSFWNSSYQAPGSLVSNHPDIPFSSNPYLSSQLHGISGLHQDPWHYTLPSQTHPYSHSHRPMHYDLTYPSMASTSRFNPNYGSLLMQPSVRTGQFGTIPGQCDLGKNAETRRSRYSDHPLSTDYTGHARLEAGFSNLDGTVQETGKDLYWF